MKLLIIIIYENLFSNISQKFTQLPYGFKTPLYDFHPKKFIPERLPLNLLKVLVDVIHKKLLFYYFQRTHKTPPWVYNAHFMNIGMKNYFVIYLPPKNCFMKSHETFKDCSS